MSIGSASHRGGTPIRGDWHPSTALPWCGTTIIQAKHTNGLGKRFSDSDFFVDGGEKTVIGKEIPRIKNLRGRDELDNYMLFSNRRLAGEAESTISGAGKTLKGQKYVLLVTDGGPNCNAGITCEGAKCTANMDDTGTCGAGIENCCDPALPTVGGDSANLLCLDDESVNTQIKALRSQGIKTFVVGIPGSEVYASYLDGFAESGGLAVTPTADRPRKYFEVRNEAELVTAFQNITGSLVRSCVVPLATKASDPTKLNVAVDCQALPQSSPGVVHWEYRANSQSIEIKGTACERITTQGVRRIDVITGCPTVVAL